MEVFSCNVALGGNRGMIVRKEYCSPAELTILRFFHGDTAVDSIAPQGKYSFEGTERDRLNEIYGEIRVNQVFDRYGNLPTDIDLVKIPDSYFEKPVNKGGRPRKQKTEVPKKTPVKSEPVYT